MFIRPVLATLVAYSIFINMMSTGRAYFLAATQRTIKYGAEKRLRTAPCFADRTLSTFALESNTAQEPTNEPPLPLLSKVNVRKMRVAELRDHLQARNLDVTGLKKDLLDRLLHYIELRNLSAKSITITNISTSNFNENSGTTQFDPSKTFALRFSAFTAKQSGTSACALLLYDASEPATHVWCATEYYPTDSFTRFEAEFRGLATCLQFLHTHGVTQLILASDNQVLLKQLTGHLQVTKPTLQPYYWRAMAAKELFTNITVSVLSTIENSNTKALARRAVATKSSFGMNQNNVTSEELPPPSPQLTTDNGLTRTPPIPVIDSTSTFLLRCDGGSRGNPGISGTGMVLYDFNTMNEIWCGWKYLGTTVTNNVAEYSSIITGLQCAKLLGVTKLIVQGDSKLIIRQLDGNYQVKEEKLKTLYLECKELVTQFESIQFQHIPREENKRADELANQAMDTEESWGIIDGQQSVHLTNDQDSSLLIHQKEEEQQPTTTIQSTNTELSLTSPIQPDRAYLLQFDGGSRGNPGKCGAGMVLFDMETRAELWCGWKYLGQSGTNNEAEYNALLLGIQCAKSLGMKHLVVEGDSLLVVKQLKGEWRVKESRLKTIYSKIMEELNELKTFKVRHIRRELNSRADQLANQAMDTEGSWGFDEN